MDILIAYCGLNCETCDIRIATVKNDDKLRKATAEKLQKLYNLSVCSPDLVNCMGCRDDGIKFSYCEKCKIKDCVNAKGYETCGNCPEMNNCEIVSGIHKHEPEALENLKRLR